MDFYQYQGSSFQFTIKKNIINNNFTIQTVRESHVVMSIDKSFIGFKPEYLSKFVAVSTR